MGLTAKVVPQAAESTWDGLLRRNPFFLEFGLELLDAIAGDCRLEELAPESVLIERGTDDGDFFVVERGRASVVLMVEGDRREVAEVKRGGLLGELSLLRGTPAGASVVARDELAVWRIPRVVFKAAIETDKRWSAALLQVLAERLFTTTAHLAFLSHAAEKVVQDEFEPNLLQDMGAQPASFGPFAETFEAMATYVGERSQRLAAEVEARTRELSAEIERREGAERDLRRLASTDPLTGLSNRRHFFEAGARELGRALRKCVPVALMALDIDHFKRVNDRFGHAAGDQVLQALTEAWRDQLRVEDILGRLGGEEFAVLAPDCNPAAAEQLAERLRASTSGLEIETDAGTAIVTVSIGVTQVDPKAPLERALERADRALYKAKDQGRNRVVLG